MKWIGSEIYSGSEILDRRHNKEMKKQCKDAGRAEEFTRKRKMVSDLVNTTGALILTMPKQYTEEHDDLDLRTQGDHNRNQNKYIYILP